MPERHYAFVICDVFTTTRFGGNPLAVVPDASGLTDAEMQRIAREFNFSESTFVLPGSGRFDRKVRIFTPMAEVPFAGHPNIGTAFVLARAGGLAAHGSSATLLFDERAGEVPVSVASDARGVRCELRAPQQLTTTATVAAGRVARVLGLEPQQVVVDTHPPTVASVGLPFLLVEVRDRQALSGIRIDMAELAGLRDEGVVPDIHVYTRSADEFDIRARMFAPFDGVPEDAATGSANAALAALLMERAAGRPDTMHWRIAQGVEMGRPSVLEARASRADSGTRVWIGGYSVMVAEGTLVLD